MAILSRLEISALRNIAAIEVFPSEHCNVIYGANGSGKTSFLEAIHLLGLGRSFRGTRLDPIIQIGNNECTVFAELADGVSIGVTKSRHSRHSLKLRGEIQKNWVDVARCLPIQVINSDTFLLLEGSPSVRRRFLDWGVFHVEPLFVDSWRRVQRCIQNRNQLLKASNLDVEQMRAWDFELVESAHQVDTARAAYFSRLIPFFRETLSELLEIKDLEIRYQRGWDQDIPYQQVLIANLNKDKKYKSTQLGPHRADIVFKIGKNYAVDILSRGQQKMLVSALKISQGELLNADQNTQGIYLVDDLPSELDRKNRAAVFRLLSLLKCQIFLTCVDERELENCWDVDSMFTTFHVKHGKIPQ